MDQESQMRAEKLQKVFMDINENTLTNLIYQGQTLYN